MAEAFDTTWMDFLPVEARLEWLRQSPEALAASWAPEDSGALPPDVSDPDLATYTALGSSPQKREALERQLAMAEQLRGQGGGNHSSVWGAALGGLSGVINSGVGAYRQQQAQQGLDALTASEDAARARFARGVRTWSPEQAANLGTISGDPVLGRYAQEQGKRDASSLRALTLEQGNRRLSLQEQEQERKIEQFAKEHGLDAERVRAAIAQGWAGINLRKQEAAQQDAGKSVKLEGELRREFNSLPEVKEFGAFDANYQGLLKAAKNHNGIGRTTAIFSFMKLIDPGVAVMEGDVDRIKAAGGPAAQFAGLYERAINGSPIPQSVIDDMVKQAGELHAIRERQIRNLERQYSGIAQQSGADPGRVVVPRGAPDTDLTKPPGSSPAGSAPAPSGMSDSNRTLYEFLKANPTHPRAEEARQKLRRQGITPP